MIVNGAVIVRQGSYACFSKAFKWLSDQRDILISSKYTIHIWKGHETGKERGWSNACLLSKKELRHHLDQLKGIVPFTYSIKETKDHSKFELIVEVNNGSKLQHKYLLSWIRYVYEYPYNVMLLEARKLRWEKEFRFESGFNLFNIVSQCFNKWQGGHSIAYGNKVKLLRKRELGEKLSDLHTSRLNNIFECSTDRGMAMVPTDSKEFEVISIQDIEYWVNDKIFAEERLPVYKKRLRYLRNKK